MNFSSTALAPSHLARGFVTYSHWFAEDKEIVVDVTETHWAVLPDGSMWACEGLRLNCSSFGKQGQWVRVQAIPAKAEYIGTYRPEEVC